MGGVVGIYGSDGIVLNDGSGRRKQTNKTEGS